MNKILCSTGAIIGRPNGRDHTLMKKALPFLDCDGYELMIYDTWSDKMDEIVDFILENKFKIFVCHLDKKIGELISHGGEENLSAALEIFEKNCIVLNRLNVKTAVLHLWGGLDSDKCFSNNLTAYAHIEKIAEKYKIDVLVENIVCSVGSPMQRMDELVRAYPNVKFIFDTKMAQFHRELDLIYDKKYSHVVSRIKHFHMNDYDGEYKEWARFRTLHIGRGGVDFDKLFEFLKEIKYDGAFTVEGTSFDALGEIDFKALNNDFSYIRSRIK